MAQKNQAAVRLGYTKIYAPVSGTVSVRAARQGEVVNIGAPIVTIVDLERHLGAGGNSGNLRGPHWTTVTCCASGCPAAPRRGGKVFFKGVEGDFATQRDVSRRKRDIKTIVLKVRLDNPKGAYVPGMTAEVLVSPDQTEGDWPPKTRKPRSANDRAPIRTREPRTPTAVRIMAARKASLRSERAHRNRG